MSGGSQQFLHEHLLQYTYINNKINIQIKCKCNHNDTLISLSEVQNFILKIAVENWTYLASEQLKMMRYTIKMKMTSIYND